jgi:hypothetical protein
MGRTKTFSTACLTDRACGQRSDRVQMPERCLLWVCVCVLQFICCCTVVPSAQRDDQRSVSQADNNAPVSGDDLIASGFFNGTPEEEKEAWRLFTKSGQYRVAVKNDFHLSEAAKKVQPNDVEKATAHPYVGGDINHDGAYHDFAVIVVDTTKNETARFGLVIFNQPAERKSSYETHWLYRDRDLSKTILEWWSGGLAVREYRDDGSYQYCYGNWDGRAKAYSCDKDFKK